MISLLGFSSSIIAAIEKFVIFIAAGIVIEFEIWGSDKLAGKANPALIWFVVPRGPPVIGSLNGTIEILGEIIFWLRSKLSKAAELLLFFA